MRSAAFDRGVRHKRRRPQRFWSRRRRDFQDSYDGQNAGPLGNQGNNLDLSPPEFAWIRSRVSINRRRSTSIFFALSIVPMMIGH